MLNFLYSPILTSIHVTEKTIALTRWTFVDKVMSLLLNMLSRLVITFLPRSKRLLVSWLQSPSAVMIQVYYICCALYFYYCYIVIYSEVIIKLTIMQSQGEP